MEHANDRLSRFSPESVRVLNYNESIKHPKTVELAEVQEFLSENYSEDTAQRMTFPMCYLSYDDASQACDIFESSVRDRLSEWQTELIYGTHIDTLTSEQGEQIYLPFIRVKTNADEMLEVQDVANAFGGNLQLGRFDYEKFGTGRIQVDQNGKLAIAMFPGPNELYKCSVDNCWYLSVTGKIGIYHSK